MLTLFIFACQSEPPVVSGAVNLPVSAPTFQAPPWPKEGVVVDSPIPLSSCLDKVPSCACYQENEEELCVPQFISEVKTLPHLMEESIRMHTWEEGCPIPLEDLRLLRVLHWTEDSKIRWGEIILTQRVVRSAQKVFSELYIQQFPVHSIKPAFEYEGSDEASMADNNTSAFNCRKIRGTNNWSEHAYGEAIDINPLWNPWVKGAKVLQKNAQQFVDRDIPRPGLISQGSSVILAFEEQGWQWGSQKKGIKDYQHFSRKDHSETYEN